MTATAPELAEPLPDRPDRAAPVAADTPTASLRDRLTPPMPSDRLLGWLVPGVIALAGGVLRFWRLGVPSDKIFDEVYYPVYAHKMLQFGVVWDRVKDQPEYVVHPPVGPWVISVGESFFGFDSYGWRFMPAVLGTLSILMIGRIARRLFRSTLLGGIAALLLALDGMHLVLSRTGILDGILSFFVLAAFGTLLLDRDASRARLARLVEAQGVGTWGPRLGLRPWRLATGVLLGLACGVKWSGLYVVAAFSLLSVIWDVAARRGAGVRRPYVSALWRDAMPAALSLVVLAGLVYLASWTGWFVSDKGWGRDWAASNPSTSWAWVGDPLRSLWHYHAQMWQFHTHLRTPHPYQSNPWSWLLLGRPVMFYYQTRTQGQNGCDASSCSVAVTAAGNPMVWWAALLALPVMLWRWAGARDWRAGAILAGVVAGYLPWFGYQERTVFSFYSVAFLPFLVLAIAMCAGMVLGGPTDSPNRRAIGASAVGLYLVLVVIVFFQYLPVLTAQVISQDHWARLMQIRSWI